MTEHLAKMAHDISAAGVMMWPGSPRTKRSDTMAYGSHDAKKATGKFEKRENTSDKQTFIKSKYKIKTPSEILSHCDKISPRYFFCFNLEIKIQIEIKIHPERKWQTIFSHLS